jgi:hypothetical protein
MLSPGFCHRGNTSGSNVVSNQKQTGSYSRQTYRDFAKQSVTHITPSILTNLFVLFCEIFHKICNYKRIILRPKESIEDLCEEVKGAMAWQAHCLGVAELRANPWLFYMLITRREFPQAKRD